jgi:hypothetical protein
LCLSACEGRKTLVHIQSEGEQNHHDLFYPLPFIVFLLKALLPLLRMKERRSILNKIYVVMQQIKSACLREHETVNLNKNGI